jgi:hypothetical protein
MDKLEVAKRAVELYFGNYSAKDAVRQAEKEALEKEKNCGGNLKETIKEIVS